MAANDMSVAGESLEDYLDGLGLREEVYATAIKDVIAWQFEQARLAQGMTKVELAAAMGTSRTQLNRVLAPDNIAVSLETLARAAAALGKKLKIELVDS